MSSILAIESDNKQAALLKCVVRNHVGAALMVVQSKDEAIAAIDADAPDLILLSALLSPRDESEVVAHLRRLDHADHLQTLTIPRFASVIQEDAPRGLLGAFKRQRAPRRTKGCDPKQFAEQITSYLQRAEEIKAERAALEQAAAIVAAAEKAPAAPAAAIPAEATRGIPLAIVDTTPPPALPDVAVAFVSAPAEAVVDSPATDTIAPSLSLPIGQEPAGAIAAPGERPGDEIRALLRSLRMPAAIAELARARGCRIRRVVVSRRSARRRAIAFAAA